ncbi:MAG: MFS transporter [Pseudomonadota bacterium]
MRILIEGALRGERPKDVLRRGTIIAIVSFLTLIDLFGSQALLPQLVVAYQVDPATMGVAVNASTFGMALSGLTVAWFADRIDRKQGIWLSLALLSIPTACLGLVDDVTLFALLRIAQGVFMAAAFTLTLTYLSEQCDITAASGAMAAYITGNVASNLFGRLLAGSLAEQIGLSGSFFAFAILNLLGALFAYTLIGPTSGPRDAGSAEPPLAAWRAHLSDARLRASFLIGFVILALFVGLFTYVNFELVGPTLRLDPMMLGAVYFVFLPSIFTTPSAGALARKWGAARGFQAGAAATILGVVLTLAPTLWLVLPGLALIAVGLFFAQAAVSGYVGRTATRAHAAANGLYLSSYYFGGLVGAYAFGLVYQSAGWSGLAGFAIALTLLGVALSLGLKSEEAAAPAV